MAYPKDVRLYAEHLYVVKCLPMSQVARLTGVSKRHLDNWARTYRWRQKRLEHQEASTALERDFVLLQSRMLARALESLDPKHAAAAAKLLAAPVGARMPPNHPAPALDEGEAKPSQDIKESIAGLIELADRKIRLGLLNPESMTAVAIRDLKDIMELVNQLKTRYGFQDDRPKGLSDETVREIRRKILGIQG